MSAAEVYERIDVLEERVDGHDRRLVAVAGEKGDNGKLGELTRRVDAGRNVVIAVGIPLLIVGLGMIASVLGAWNSLSNRLSAIEARQQFLIEEHHVAGGRR